MWPKRKSQEDVDEGIIKAIRLCGPEGASLIEIQQYLIATLQDNVPDLESIQSSLNNEVSKGVLLELDNGKYKIKDSAEATTEDANIDVKVKTKSFQKDNDTNATAKEKAQEIGRSADKVAQDADQNADSDKRSLGSSMTEEDGNVSLPDDYDKVLTKLHRLHHEDSESKATGGRIGENPQDAYRKADSDKGNVGASATVKDINSPLPADNDEIDVVKMKDEKMIKKDK